MTDHKTAWDNALSQRISHQAEAGTPVPVDPDVAEMMAAFDEPALTLEDALDSRFDGDVPAALQGGAS